VVKKDNGKKKERKEEKERKEKKKRDTLAQRRLHLLGRWPLVCQHRFSCV